MIYLKDSKIKVTSAKEVAKVFQDILALEEKIDQEKEHYYVMHLDTRSQVKMVELVTIGILEPVHNLSEIPFIYRHILEIFLLSCRLNQNCYIPLCRLRFRGVRKRS